MSRETEFIEISLFPIPGSVAMPYSNVPLHIFEPRYRKMISESIAAKRRIGVCHTKRQISQSKTNPNIDLKDYLKSNHESYEPYTIFSAGLAELLETTEDGRMVVQIPMDGRYELIEVLQEVPYTIVKCTKYNDVETKSEDVILALRKSLDIELIDLCQKNQPTLMPLLESPEWSDLSHEEYSFAIFSLVLLEPNMKQMVLELKSVNERIRFLQESLSQNYLQ